MLFAKSLAEIDAKMLVYILSLLLILVIPFSWFISHLMSMITKVVLDAHPKTYILLTAGDSKRRDVIESKKIKNRNFAIFLATGVIISFIVNVFSSYVYEYISP